VNFISPLALLVLLLTGCEKRQSVDCTRLDLAGVERCYERNRARGEVAAMVSCLPFSATLKTGGIWVVGFEKNDFWEGPLRPSPQVLKSQSTGAELIVDEATFKPSPDIRAYEVEVGGRRALCPIGVVNPYPIAVEKLRIRRRVA
jgi:hypothetical protein